MKRLAQAHSTLWRFRKAALALCVAIVLAFTPWALSLPDTPARAGFDLYPETDNRAVLRRAAASGPGALFPAAAGTRAFDVTAAPPSYDEAALAQLQGTLPPAFAALLAGDGGSGGGVAGSAPDTAFGAPLALVGVADAAVLAAAAAATYAARPVGVLAPLGSGWHAASQRSLAVCNASSVPHA